jgi:predicted protein tyrosine phosphatase
MSTSPTIRKPDRLLHPERQRPSGRVHVCPFSAVSLTVSRCGASHLLTCLHDDMQKTPSTIHPDKHLRLAMHDIAEPMEGCNAPNAQHIAQLIEFARDWGGHDAMVVHCWAGISRSTAAAFISLCTINPDASEEQIARRLRQASPTAYPNRLMVRLADEALARRGRMIEAVECIGRGEIASEAIPFSLAADLAGDAAR